MVHKISMTVIGMYLLLGVGQVVYGTEAKQGEEKHKIASSVGLVELWKQAGETSKKRITPRPLCHVDELLRLSTGQWPLEISALIIDYCGTWKKYRSFKTKGKVAFAVCMGKRVLLAPHCQTFYRIWGSDDIESIIWPVAAWNLETGSHVGFIPGNRTNVIVLSVTPDGSKIVVCNGDKKVRIYKASSLQELATLPAVQSTTDLVCCGISPDSTLLAVAGAGVSVTIWDLATFKKISEFPQSRFFEQNNTLDVESICFSPNSQLMALRSKSHVEVWDVLRKTLIHFLKAKKRRNNFGVLFFQDNTHLIWPSSSLFITRWDVSLPAGKLQKSKEKSIVSFDPYFEYSLDGVRQASGSAWDTYFGPKDEEADGHLNLEKVSDFRTLSPCGEFFATVNDKSREVQLYHQCYDVGE